MSIRFMTGAEASAAFRKWLNVGEKVATKAATTVADTAKNVAAGKGVLGSLPSLLPNSVKNTLLTGAILLGAGYVTYLVVRPSRK